jgi:hypothetical protein
MLISFAEAVQSVDLRDGVCGFGCEQAVGLDPRHARLAAALQVGEQSVRRVGLTGRSDHDVLAGTGSLVAIRVRSSGEQGAESVLGDTISNARTSPSVNLAKFS